jgi:ABC-2 type transport system ATP-binding protein
MERVVDHLILLTASHVQLSGDIDSLLAEHRVLVGPHRDTAAIARTHTIVQALHTARQTTLLVRGTAPVIDPAWESSDVGLEEMVLAYMGQDAAAAASHLTSVGEGQ